MEEAERRLGVRLGDPRVALRHATVEPGERDVRLPALGVKGRELIRRICGAPGHLP